MDRIRAKGSSTKLFPDWIKGSLFFPALAVPLSVALFAYDLINLLLIMSSSPASARPVHVGIENHEFSIILGYLLLILAGSFATYSFYKRQEAASKIIIIYLIFQFVFMLWKFSIIYENRTVNWNPTGDTDFIDGSALSECKVSHLAYSLLFGLIGIIYLSKSERVVDAFYKTDLEEPETEPENKGERKTPSLPTHDTRGQPSGNSQSSAASVSASSVKGNSTSGETIILTPAKHSVLSEGADETDSDDDIPDDHHAEEPEMSGIFCKGRPGAPDHAQEDRFLIFFGAGCRREKKLFLENNKDTKISYFSAPSEAALANIFPDGLCYKCGGQHIRNWEISYSFRIPEKRGKTMSPEAFNTWCDLFTSEIRKQDKNRNFSRINFDWQRSRSGKFGCLSFKSQDNSQWLRHVCEILEQSYLQTVSETSR